MCLCTSDRHAWTKDGWSTVLGTNRFSLAAEKWTGGFPWVQGLPGLDQARLAGVDGWRSVIFISFPSSVRLHIGIDMCRTTELAECLRAKFA